MCGVEQNVMEFENKIFFLLFFLLFSCTKEEKIDLNIAQRNAEDWAQKRQIPMNVVVCEEYWSSKFASCDVVEKETNRIISLLCWKDGCSIQQSQRGSK